jgi:hypothetical protein
MVLRLMMNQNVAFGGLIVRAENRAVDFSELSGLYSW